MDLARFGIDRPLYVWLVVAACVLGGAWALGQLARLEDPTFTFKDAYIVTAYPGASPEEVEREVTDIIENAVQQLPDVMRVTSKSLPGRSEVRVSLFDETQDHEIAQVWDELRRRVRDNEYRLPPGARTPQIEDDFGDVYGILYAVTAPGYEASTVRDIARRFRRELALVPGVAKVSTSGEPEDAIYIEIERERLASFGLPLDAVLAAVGAENQVVPAGAVRAGEYRLRIESPPAYDSVQSVGDLRIGLPGSTQIVRLGEVARISRGPTELPLQLVRHDGEPAFTLGVSVRSDINVVEVGADVDAHIARLLRELPVGVELHPVYQQHRVVERAVRGFLGNLVASVITVVAALCLFMGWRSGFVVGVVLVCTVMATLWIMAIAGIQMHRISIGAMMIAMGMLVDNAIVVAEGMLIGVQRGLGAAEAASRSLSRTQWPLLGATVIGILAFAGIGLSEDQSGQFFRSLFWVITISLMLSWVLAVALTPLFGAMLLKPPRTVDESRLYAGRTYGFYRGVLGAALRAPWTCVVLLLATTVASILGFGLVKQGFFPFSNAPIFYVDYFRPQGTDIRATADRVVELEDWLGEQPEVLSTTTSVGRGPVRFIMTFFPEQPNPAYAHVLVQLADLGDVAPVMRRLSEWSVTGLDPDAVAKLTRPAFGIGTEYKIEARWSGEDADVLRSLAEETVRILQAARLADLRTDWRMREPVLVPRFDEERARIAGVARADLAQALEYASTGVTVGLYREREDLVPIIARAPADERDRPDAFGDRLVYGPALGRQIPLSQVVREMEVEPRDAVILRRDRVRTITVQANPPPDETAAETFARVHARIEAIEAPPGYRLEWGGEHEGVQEAQSGLFANLPLTYLGMWLISVLMFGRLRQPAVIWLTVPMCVCGITIGLLVSQMSFTFMSLLGFLSLTGMLLKNGIVLVDEIDARIEAGEPRDQALRTGSVSRLRPVMLAAGTTIAGMSPLLADPFFADMAVTIMGGLAFATILTLVAVPVFYRLMIPERGPAHRTPTPASGEVA